MKMQDALAAAKQGIRDREPDAPIEAGGPGSGRRPGAGHVSDVERHVNVKYKEREKHVGQFDDPVTKHHVGEWDDPVTVKPVKAGGPGSGRHKSELEKYGFQKVKTTSNGTTVFQRGRAPVSSFVHVHDDGSWERGIDNPVGGVTRMGTGADFKSLSTHLKERFGK